MKNNNLDSLCSLVQWAKIVVVMERGISRKNLLKFQQAYSVRLAGAARPDHASPPIPEERALVVIRSCSKSKAKTRKDAVFRWKVCLCLDGRFV